MKISEKVATLVLCALLLHIKWERNWNGVEVPSEYQPRSFGQGNEKAHSFLHLTD